MIRIIPFAALLMAMLASPGLAKDDCTSLDDVDDAGTESLDSVDHGRTESLDSIDDGQSEARDSVDDARYAEPVERASQANR